MAPFMMMAAFVLGAGGRERVVDEMVAAGPPGVRIWLLARVRGEERAVRRAGRLGGVVWRTVEPGEGGREWVVPSRTALEGPLEMMWPDRVACWPERRVEVPMMRLPLGPLMIELPARRRGVGL